MGAELFWLLSFCGFAAMALVCGLLAWPQLSAAWPSIEERIDRFRRQPPLAKVVLLVFVIGFIAYGSTKTNQVDQASGTNEVEIVGGGGQTNLLTCAFGLESDDILLCPPPPLYSTSTVTPADIARGWQLWEVKTNCNISYAMPESAAFATNWWVRGAYEDVNQFDFGEWRFPFGSNGYSSVWALTWGKLRFALADTNTEIVAVGAPMSAVPCRSRLWSAADTNGSRLVTWENFALNRDTNTPVNAQVELRTTGDFITRSNEVETVYRRLDPEDWDNDGWRNDDDPDPYVWEEYWDSFWQELPEGANSNVYYWVDIRPRWNSYIEFFGDGPSDLDDPCIWAKAGETYRVQLLIGKTYDVESDRPFDIVAKSDARVEVSNVEPNSCTVVWPVTLTVAEGRAPTGRPRLGATWNDGGSTFHVLPDPPWLNGRIVWDTYCCALQGDGTNFTFACDGNCTCEGCTASGNYIYAGYALPFWSWPCGCGHVDDQGDPGVAIDFDKSAIIYEDAYTNKPGVVVHSTCSNAVLRCSVAGGTYGGTLSVTLNGAAQQKLRKVWGDELPNNLAIAPGAVRFFVTEYEILEPSGTMNDICATAEFLEDFRNVPHSDNASMTAVKVELTAEKVALLNPCQQRHIYGVGETVSFAGYPSDIVSSWQIIMNGEPAVMAVGYPNVFYCSWTNAIGTATVNVDGVSYSTQLTVVEPEIEIRNVRANDRFSEEAKMWDPTLVDVNPVVGEAGHLLLFMDRYAAPYYVSFEGLQFVEIPDESHNCPHDRQGYYADETRGGPLSHTQLSGAGRWRSTNSQAFFGTDAAGTHEAYSQPWQDGWKSWPIPMGWGYGIGVLGRFKDYPTFQTYTLSSDGTFRIEKFGHWAERNTLGMVWVDGSLQISSWSW